MFASFKRGAVVLAASAALTAGAAVAAVPEASAGSLTEGAVTVNCSWGSCSYYLSRSATRELQSRIELASVAHGLAGTAVCAPFLPIPAVGKVLFGVCEAGAGLKTAIFVDTVNAAKEGDRCFKVTVAHAAIPAFTAGALGFAVSTGSYYYSTNNGRFLSGLTKWERSPKHEWRPNRQPGSASRTELVTTFEKVTPPVRECANGLLGTGPTWVRPSRSSLGTCRR